MNKRSLFLTIGLLVLNIYFFIPSVAFPLFMEKREANHNQSVFAPDRLIVKLKPEVDKGITLSKAQEKITTGLVELDKLNSKFNVIKQEKLFKEFKETALKSDKLSSIYILEVLEGTDLKQMKSEYENRPEVEYAEIDYFENLYGQPDDTLFSNQWYLNNTGQGYLGINRIPGDYNDTQVIKYGSVDADIDALEVFEKNAETTLPLVGIIDTGVDLVHIDLVDNLWTNLGEIPVNGIDDDHNGFVDDFYGWDFSGDSVMIQEDNDPTDTYGHGTHCAGIVAGVRGNGIGISGINTPCRIMAIKVFPIAFFSVCAKGIVYSADMGCDIINMSWGSNFPSMVIKDALNYAISKGVLPVAASGNSGGEDYFYPASLEEVFTAGASNSKDEVTYFSTYGSHIEVVGPGEDILSLRADTTDMYAEGGASGQEPLVHIVDNKYYLADGTSMASPCVVGVAAYIISASPGISNERVKEIIEHSADDILYPYGGDSLFSPGKDIYSGYGRVNLNSALKLLSGRLAKIDYPNENAIVSGYVPVTGTASGDSFQNFVLEYGEGLLPVSWTEIVNLDVPVSKDTLGIWNSSSLTGLYALRLSVGDKNQAIVRVIAQNGINVKITSPVENDTIRGLSEVYGYTIVPDFSRYTLEYGYGESPSTWVPITTSTKIVASDIMCKWSTSFLPAGIFTLRLSAEDNRGQVYTDEVKVIVESITSGGWFKNLSNYGSLSPVTGDIDGLDDYDEIVVGVGGPAGWGKTGGVEVFNHQGEREFSWPKDNTYNMMSSPALGDLDGDGIDDIVICSEKGIHAYLSISDTLNWFRSAGTGGNSFWTLASPMIADLDKKDGYLEVLMINNQGIVYAWRNNGKPVILGNNGIFAQAVPSVTEGFPSLAIADLDGDNINEVIAGAANENAGGIYIWKIDGTSLLVPGDYPDKFTCTYGIAITDVDAKGDLEVITFGENNEHPVVCAFKKNGGQASGYPIILDDLIAGNWFGNPPAIGDLERDGVLEIVVSIWTLGEARIYAWHQDGTPLSTAGPLVSIKSPDVERKKEVFSRSGQGREEAITEIKSMSQEKLGGFILNFRDTIFASVAETFGNPVLADVNADGYVDIVVRAGTYLSSGYERVFAWDYEGNLIPGFPLYASSEPSILTNFPYSPVITDMDKDGKLNLILATDWPENKLICWEFNTDYQPKTMHWPKYMHDKANSGVFRLEDYTEVKGEEEIQVPTFFSLSQNYPNPLNPSTTMPFQVGSLKFGVWRPIHANLTIYNILGQRVRTLVNENKLPGRYEIFWDGKDDKGKEVSSGIYFYQLKAGGFKETRKMVLLR